MMRSAIADLAPALDALKKVGDYISKNETQIALAQSAMSDLEKTLRSPSMLEFLSAKNKALAGLDLGVLNTRAFSNFADAFTTPSFLDAITARHQAFMTSLNSVGMTADAISNIGEMFKSFDAEQSLFASRLESVFGATSVAALEYLDEAVDGPMVRDDPTLWSEEEEEADRPDGDSDVLRQQEPSRWGVPAISRVAFIYSLLTTLSAASIALAATGDYLSEQNRALLQSLAVGFLMVLLGLVAAQCIADGRKKE